MQKIAVIQISEAGRQVAHRLCSVFHAEVIERQAVAAHWGECDAFVFIGALGICVRTIAPLIANKHTDPAVVCIDSFGQHVISVLSGHVGGANALTQKMADTLGAKPVITTQSDNAGLWALDTLDSQWNWRLANPITNRHIFTFVQRQPTALWLQHHDAGTESLRATMPDHVTLIDDLGQVTPQRFRLLIMVSPFTHPAVDGVLTLHFVPPVAHIGFGLAHQASPAEEICKAMLQIITAAGIHPMAVHTWSTIDVKADEPVVHLLHNLGHHLRFFTSAELSAVSVPNPSNTVARHVGTPSVSEAAALLSAHTSILFLPKQKGSNYTIAIALAEESL